MDDINDVIDNLPKHPVQTRLFDTENLENNFAPRGYFYNAEGNLMHESGPWAPVGYYYDKEGNLQPEKKQKKRKQATAKQKPVAKAKKTQTSYKRAANKKQPQKAPKPQKNPLVGGFTEVDINAYDY